MNNLLILLFLFTSFLIAQNGTEDYIEVPSKYGYPVKLPANVSANFTIKNEAANQQMQFLLAISINNSYLQFQTEGKNEYLSRYMVTAYISQEDKTFASNSVQKDAKEKNFEHTISRYNAQYITLTLNVKAPQSFNLNRSFFIHFTVNDLNRNHSETFKIEGNFKPDIEERGTLSFWQEKELIPTLQLVPYNQKVNALFFLWQQNAQHEDIRFELTKEGVSIDTFYIVHNAVNTNDYRFSLPYEKMEEGAYHLKVYRHETLLAEKQFEVVWFKKPLYLYKHDLALRPLTYLLSAEENKTIDNLRIGEVNTWFKTYWQKKDPTPKTVHNEIMEEYYKRVSHTVKQFSTSHKEGWETDRGKIYLLWGNPDSVVNGRYATWTNPFITWHYYRDNDTTIFNFIDKEINGEYWLLEE